MSQTSINQPKWLLPLLVLPFLTWSVKAFAHGVDIIYKRTQAIQIIAAYDQGQPMANAQVVIYAPNDPATPWVKGQTDDQGRFSFIPDPNQPGNWDIKVRQSGHGALITIPIDENITTDATNVTNQSQFNVMQKVLMSVSGVWGFVGTALFFSRKAKG